MNDQNKQPLSTQGDITEKDDQLGGTTNLSLDQLKEEDGIANTTEDNPDRIDNVDDLHEIRVADDLGEPDADEYQSDSTENNELTGGRDVNEEPSL